MEKKNISFIYLAITVIIMTFSMRATNNMIVTTVPLLAKIDLGFSRFLVGIISAVIYLFTFTVTFYINPRLNSRIRRHLFIGANFAILFSLISYYFANGITIWAISALAGLAYGKTKIKAEQAVKQNDHFIIIRRGMTYGKCTYNIYTDILTANPDAITIKGGEEETHARFSIYYESVRPLLWKLIKIL
ncbi:hypothetical protein [Acidiplasma sp.]|uniref:hypothetical protein n=1 Tax=Acidiplasma sp. TaxID=1872114 RepID=UPI00259007FE|nr:hypothetical protein [Acidiplasma sp.]